MSEYNRAIERRRLIEEIGRLKDENERLSEIVRDAEQRRNEEVESMREQLRIFDRELRKWKGAGRSNG